MFDRCRVNDDAKAKKKKSESVPKPNEREKRRGATFFPSSSSPPRSTSLFFFFQLCVLSPWSCSRIAFDQLGLCPALVPFSLTLSFECGEKGARTRKKGSGTFALSLLLLLLLLLHRRAIVFRRRQGLKRFCSSWPSKRRPFRCFWSAHYHPGGLNTSESLLSWC